MMLATMALCSALVLAQWSHQLTSGEARSIYLNRMTKIEPHLSDFGVGALVPGERNQALPIPQQTPISFVQAGSDDDDDDGDTAGSENSEKDEDKQEEAREARESKDLEDGHPGKEESKESQAESQKEGGTGGKKHGKKRKHGNSTEGKKQKITQKHPSSLTSPQEQSDYLRTSLQKAASATYKASLKLVKMLDHLNGAVSLANAIVKVPTGETSFSERVSVSAAGQKITLQGLLQEATNAKAMVDKLFTILLAAKHSIIGDVNSAIVTMSSQTAPSHK